MEHLGFLIADHAELSKNIVRMRAVTSLERWRYEPDTANALSVIYSSCA